MFSLFDKDNIAAHNYIVTNRNKETHRFLSDVAKGSDAQTMSAAIIEKCAKR